MNIYDHIITYMMIFYEEYISKWKYEYIWRVFLCEVGFFFGRWVELVFVVEVVNQDIEYIYIHLNVCEWIGKD